MDILEKLNDIAGAVADKTTEALDAIKLNAKMSSERSAIADKYKKLGSFYYKKHLANEVLDPDVMELCEAIDEHNKVIREAQAELDRMKKAYADDGESAADAEIICPTCGKKNDAARKDCIVCGARLVVETQEKASEEPVKAAEETGPVCPVCGVAVTDGMRYCAICGAKLEG